MSISLLLPKIARTLKTQNVFLRKLRCPPLPMATMSAQEKKLGGILPNFSEDGIFQNLGPALNSIPRTFSFQSGKEKEKEKKEEEEPILPKNQSLLDVEGEEDGVARSDSDFSRHLIRSSNGQRRRRNGSNGNFQENLLPGMPVRRQQSFREDVGHAAAETYLLTGLSFKLLRYLGVGYRWITKFLALGCYAMLLMPGFLQVGYYYFTSQQVRRSIVYGAERRNRLDLYMPSHVDEPKPVVAFVTGGAWIIGYKAWGALLGQGLAERDVIVACIDYRNFPQGTISDMINDASQGISFVCNNISAYGGDPNRIYVMGQSAGAHIAACVLMEQAQKESSGSGECSWSISQIKSYFGISGGYNLPNLVEHFHQRGLYRSIFLSVMEGEQSLLQFSPEAFVRDENNKNAVSSLPPIILFHGTKDCSIPYDASKTFADALVSSGARVELIVYEGKTHTDLFLQDPLRGGHDDLLHSILDVIHADNPAAQAEDASAPPRRRLVPELMIKLARRISPF